MNARLQRKLKKKDSLNVFMNFDFPEHIVVTLE